LFGNEELTIRYYLVQCGFSPFNTFFARETTEHQINESIEYYKVYYENNILIKYEIFTRPHQPEYIDLSLVRSNTEARALPNREIPIHSLLEICNFVYDDKGRLIGKNLIYNNIFFYELKIEYKSNGSAYYYETRNEIRITEGQILFDGNKINYFSTIDSDDNKDSRFAKLHTQYEYKENEIKILQYTDFGNDAEWILTFDDQNRIVDYKYTLLVPIRW
jgi:hypothetical protein